MAKYPNKYDTQKAYIISIIRQDVDDNRLNPCEARDAIEELESLNAAEMAQCFKAWKGAEEM